MGFVLWHMWYYGQYGITWGTVVECIMGWLNYTIYNSGWDIPSLCFHFIITTTLFDCYILCIALLLLCQLPLLLKLFYLWESSNYFVDLWYKLGHLFTWEVTYSIIYIHAIEHGLPVILNNLVNLNHLTVNLESGIALASGKACVTTRLSLWEYLW